MSERDYPLAAFGHGLVEAEQPLECPKCAILFDLRFWGRGEIRWMDRSERYNDVGTLVCPECKTSYPMDELLGMNE